MKLWKKVGLLALVVDLTYYQSLELTRLIVLQWNDPWFLDRTVLGLPMWWAYRIEVAIIWLSYALALAIVGALIFERKRPCLSR